MISQFDGYKFQIQSNYVPRNNPIKDTHRYESRGGMLLARSILNANLYSILVSNYGRLFNRTLNAERTLDEQITGEMTIEMKINIFDSEREREREKHLSHDLEINKTFSNILHVRVYMIIEPKKKIILF